MNNDLISREALKTELSDKEIYVRYTYEYGDVIPLEWVISAINNAPTIEQECYITGAQWDEFMKEHRRRTGAYDKIKAIINGWAVDDDEHELLEQIANIIDEETKNESDNNL